MTRQNDAHLATGAYVLHALDAEETVAVESAAERSEELRSELAELSDTAVLLGLAVRPDAPPPALKARLLAAIDDLPQLPAAERAEEEAVPTPVSGVHVAPRRRRRRRAPILVAVAAAVALVFGGGVLVDRMVVAPQTAYAAITSASDVQFATAKVQGGGTATVAWSASRHGTAVVLHGVSTPSGRVLQLWRMKGLGVTSAGLYGGDFALLSGTPSSGEKLAVSVEPAGGSAQPTTTPITVVSL